MNGRPHPEITPVKPRKKMTVGADLQLPAPSNGTLPERKSSVAKVSHTLSLPLAERLEEFAFFQRISESAVIEHSLNIFFEQSGDDVFLGDLLRRGGASRRRKT